MKPIKLTILAALTALILTAAVSCGKSVKDMPSVTIFTPGASDYTFVFSVTDHDKIYIFANDLAKQSGASPEVRNDRKSPAELEFIVGNADRELSKELAAQLETVASDDAFHYIIAEKDGNVAILADDLIGYQYARDYINATYIREDGSFMFPIGYTDLQTVTWDEYHESDYYAEVLKAEAEKLERQKQREAEELLRKQQEFEMLKIRTVSFNTADFGTRETFPAGKYAKPIVYPSAGHPRILFTAGSIDEVRANLNAEENKNAYNKYLEFSDTTANGILSKPSEGKHNMDYQLMAAIESKAFRYAMTGDEYYGYQAIYAIKNVLLTLDIPDGTLGDDCRAFGYVMYIAGCVYDWCYDLLTDDCKKQLINGCVELMGKEMEIGVPPTKQGAITGHGTEAQLLRDWLTFAIACYDEAPDIYELVAGRLFSEYVEGQNYYFKSENHWEGSAYGPYRLHFALYTQYLIDRMTDGKVRTFSDDMHAVATTMMHYLRPDGQGIRIGDVWGETGTVYSTEYFYKVAFYAANYYGDEVLKDFAREGLNDYTVYGYSNNALTPVMFLTLNDPTLGYTDHNTKSLVRLTKEPQEAVFARTAWNDKNAAMVYMTMPRAHGFSHAHMDCGSFQIFYKGILASDSGKYASWGSTHHFEYTMQTVSSNSLLIYNPNLADQKYQNYTYSGGQTYMEQGAKNTLTQNLKNRHQFQCVSLGAANVESDGRYRYSYLAGDMTKAYDESTVDEVTRYILSAATDDEKYPLVLATFDRITSDDASYRKSALIHVQQEPTITDDGFAIVTNTRNGNSGKMVVQTAGDATEYNVIGGEGKRYWLYDRNSDVDDTVGAGSVEEYGWGRIEISPKNAEKTNTMLTIMYVTDAENNAAPIKAQDISTDKLAGTVILGNAMLFPKNTALLEDSAEFTTAGTGELNYYIAGVKAGKWTVTAGGKTQTVEVRDGENILTFTASAGSVAVSSVK